jgi:hypothetical protein
MIAPAERVVALLLSWATGSMILAMLSAAQAQQSTEELAAAAQNPVAAMISLPFQNNTYFNLGPNHDQTANILNIQPVVPFSLGEWNIISRTIAPLVYVPSLSLPSLSGDIGGTTLGTAATRETFGLGDINQSLFFSPAAPSEFIWGVGPSVNLPTATSNIIGSGKLSIGPTAVGVVTPKPWVIGALAHQLWSVAGAGGRAPVSQLLIQPFVNYNLPDGWYVVSAPIITANWNAAAGQRWAVPLGGGFGKVFRIGDQPINAGLQFYGYAAHPSLAPTWSIRFAVQFLFPR